MTEYPTAGDLASKYDRDRRLDFLQRQGKNYVKGEIQKILDDRRYQTDQQKQTAINLLKDGYAIDADEARSVFESLPKDPTNDQYSR